MKIGILGAGKIGGAIARHAAKAGYEVIVSNSRGPSTLTRLVSELGPSAKAGTTAEAASAPVVFLCVVWDLLPALLPTLPAWGGRIVVDTTNPYVRSGSDFVLLDTGESTSSQIVAGMVEGARLVKGFNTMPAEVLARDPLEGGGRRVAFLSGDDQQAKDEIVAIANQMGFAPIDLGSLSIGGRLQQAGHPLAGLNLVRY